MNLEKENMIIVLLVVVIMIAAFQTFQLISLKSAPATGAATASSNQGFSSYEDMMEAHHGGGSAGTGMVGGC